ncbi:response regulator transcription factor [Brevibacterium album]|uniref:response regulator transcription factor n=1 Tax=Brevibacterium album TaxID=417948 RepID=UPI00040F5117|nr:response regulator transcription factor [Brevibacterium album]
MRVLHVTPGARPATGPVLLALAHLPHSVAHTGTRMDALASAAPADVIVLDATADLTAAAGFTRVCEQAGREEPVLAVLTEGGLIAANPEWRMSDIVLASAGPAEVDARLRLAAARGQPPEHAAEAAVIEVGPLRIDEDAYVAFVRGRQLDLTFKEFELLRHLAANAGRALTRPELLQDVWGYDFFGGTRTVDVHVRRLRAKLGAELDQVIHTVRNVGYRFSPEIAERAAGAHPGESAVGEEAAGPSETGSARTDPAGRDAGQGPGSEGPGRRERPASTAHDEEERNGSAHA